MNQQFNFPLGYDCFGQNQPFECDFLEEETDLAAKRRNLMRKLSFQDSGIDFHHDSNEESLDFLTEFFNNSKRKVTEQPMFQPNSKRPCNGQLSPSNTFQLQDDQSNPFLPNQRDYHMLFESPPTEKENIELQESSMNMMNASAMNSSSTRMEEEFNEPAPFAEIEKEPSLMERLNGNTAGFNSPFMKDKTNLHLNRGLSLNTNMTFTRTNDSPTSCLVKTQSCHSEFSFNSPRKRHNNSILNTCKNLRDPDLRTITPETLVDLMENPNGQKYLIIDCRFEYEYKGGHIHGAINVLSPEDLEELLIKHREMLFHQETLDLVKADWRSVVYGTRGKLQLQEVTSDMAPPILIFHCEFSQKRGPRALRALRGLDRTINHINWPSLFYPEVYILENGYKNFHSKFPQYCDPQNQYIRMVDKAYKTFYTEAKIIDRNVWKSKDADVSPKPFKLQRFKTMHCL